MRTKFRGVLAAALALSLGLAACGTDEVADPDPPTSPDPTGEPSPDPEPEPDFDPDGEFTFGFTIGPFGFDPHTVGPQLAFYPFQAPVYDRLTQINVVGEVEPMLATDWEWADDGSSLTLTLRDDVVFHDGAAFDAEVAKANIDRGRTHERSTTVATQLEAITEVEVVDDYTIRLHVDEGASRLLFFLGLQGGMMVSPNSLDDEELDRNPAGSGPYEVETFEPQERAVYTRFDGYWDPSVQKAARFTLMAIPDDVARISALQDGQIDIANVRGDALRQAEALAATGDFEIVVYPSTTGNQVLFSRMSEALQDLRIRQALVHAIDRQAIADDFLEGNCLRTDQPLIPDWAGFDPALEGMYEYDPDEARRLLAEAGAENLTLTGLQYATTEPARTIAEIIQEQWSQVGVTVNLEPLDIDELSARFRAGEADVWFSFGSSLPDPALYLFRILNPVQNPGDLASFSPRIAEILDDLFDQSLSEQEQADLFREASREYVENVVDIPICWSEARFIARSNITGMDNLPFSLQNVFDTRHLGVAP